jgi:hypothetical protein
MLSFFWRYILTSCYRKRVKSGTTRPWPTRGKKVKPKQATLTTQKSIGSGERLGGGDDDEDDDEDDNRTRRRRLPKSGNHRTHRR